ncbi:MAG: hypothetical protein IKG59_07215 [Firmicutes bacterium]|nr:hypothetical protein [Bacillota bacterium]
MSEKRSKKANALSSVNKRAAIVLICIVLLAAIFIVDLVRQNHDAAIRKQELTENLQKVSSFDFGNVVDVEALIAQIDEERAILAAQLAEIEADEAENGPNYRRIFDRCAILGESITEGLVVYGYLGEDIVFSGIGAGVSKDRFLSVASLYPRCVFFSYGMNDMGNYGGDAKAFIEDYEDAIKAFMEASPTTRVFVNSISMPDDYAISNQPVLGNYLTFNSEISSMCSRLGITYIDITHILQEDPDLYAGDGIHVSSSYYPIWMDLMRESAGLV